MDWRQNILAYQWLHNILKCRKNIPFLYQLFGKETVRFELSRGFYRGGGGGGGWQGVDMLYVNSSKLYTNVLTQLIGLSVLEYNKTLFLLDFYVPSKYALTIYLTQNSARIHTHSWRKCGLMSEKKSIYSEVTIQFYFFWQSSQMHSLYLLFYINNSHAH